MSCHFPFIYGQLCLRIPSFPKMKFIRMAELVAIKEARGISRVLFEKIFNVGFFLWIGVMVMKLGENYGCSNDKII